MRNVVVHQAITEANGGGTDGPHPVTRQQMAGDVAWIDGKYVDDFIGSGGGFVSPGLTQRPNGFDRGVLFAGESADEPTAANQATGLEPTKGPQHLAPRNG